MKLYNERSNRALKCHLNNKVSLTTHFVCTILRRNDDDTGEFPYNVVIVLTPHWFSSSINFQFLLFKIVRNSFNFGIRIQHWLLSFSVGFSSGGNTWDGVKRLATQLTSTHIYNLCMRDAYRWIYFISGFNHCYR